MWEPDAAFFTNLPFGRLDMESFASEINSITVKCYQW